MYRGSDPANQSPQLTNGGMHTRQERFLVGDRGWLPMTWLLCGRAACIQIIVAK